MITVEDRAAASAREPESNGGALVLRTRQIAALSDDPEELAMQLQALAGPAPGPNGGQMYIDGFTGRHPAAEVRHPRDARQLQPIFARVRPSRLLPRRDLHQARQRTLRGQAFAQFNDRILNSRNPLLTEAAPLPHATLWTESQRPDAPEQSFVHARVEHRGSTKTASCSRPSSTRPQSGHDQPGRRRARSRAPTSARAWTMRSPRRTPSRSAIWNCAPDWTTRASATSTCPPAHITRSRSEHTVQVTETAMLSPQAINESRFQFQRSVTRDIGLDDSPAIDVQGAFNGGGAISGISGTSSNSWEWTNISTVTRGRHTLKWGGRVRQSILTDTSRFNFAGVYTFYTLDQYRRHARRSTPGAGRRPTFRLSCGHARNSRRADRCGAVPQRRLARAPQRDHQHGTALRGPNQSVGSSRLGAARRLVAWSITKKTVLRAGAGAFYDRVPLSVTLNARRYNGTTQQSYMILNPGFFPSIPSAAALETDRQPQQLQPVAGNLNAPRLYQTSLGIERQINQVSRVTLTWIGSRGVHLLNARNMNAPIGGAYPYGDPSIRLLTESAGVSRQNQAIANVNITHKRVFLFGYYALSYGRDNNEGLPANPYNLRAEWGPSSYADLHHKVVVGTSIPMPARIAVNPFFAANSGQPYNITTGLDPNNTGYPAARPALVPGCSPQNATDAACFRLQGSPTIGHNFARGPGAVNLALRVSRTWSLDPHYSLTLTASTLNALNHANFAAPAGNLTSPYFGQSRSLGGFIVMAHDGTPSSYNRKLDLQVRLTF